MQVLEWEINQYEQDLTEVKNYLLQRKEEQEAKIIPEISRLQKMIADLEREVEESSERIGKEVVIEKEMAESISVLGRETEKLQEESEVSAVALNKAKTEPLRFSKNAEILQKAINGMLIDLGKVMGDAYAGEEDVQRLLREKEDQKSLILSLQQEIKNDSTMYENLQKQKDDIGRKKLQASEKEKE